MIIIGVMTRYLILFKFTSNFDTSFIVDWNENYIYVDFRTPDKLIYIYIL